MGQHVAKQMKMTAKVDINGAQTSNMHTICTCANWIALFEHNWMIPQDAAEQPLLIYAFHEFANFIPTTKFMDYYNKHFTQCPWIPQTMLAMLQWLMSMMAKLPCNHKYLAAAMSGRDIDATEFFEVKVAVQHMIHDLKSCVNNNTTGNLFTRPPSTWVAPADPKTPPKTNTPGSHNDRNSKEKNKTN
eukprot:14453890-Ditylum_brightwellii.AAC.1